MKNIKFIYSKRTLLLVFMFSVILNCERNPSDEVEFATLPTTAEVFIDGFSGGLDYYPFGDSYFEAFSVDNETAYQGSAAMRFDVPNVGDPAGAYAGAIFRTAIGRDLSGYDALTFWAKGTRPGTINEIGFGQDFGENKYQVSTSLQLTTNWRKYIIPIPDASKLFQERGMFWYAEGPENGEGYSFWIDELQFEKLGTLAQPQPAIFNGVDEVAQSFIGVGGLVEGLSQTFNTASGHNQTVSAAPAYFMFNSSDPSVATVTELGVISVIGKGTATITAAIAGVEAKGSLTIEASGSFNPAPTPTEDAADVIALFSNTYTNVPVDFFNGYYEPYQTTTSNDFTVNNDDVLGYENYNFVGIEFKNPTVNASNMNVLHLDIYVPGNVASLDGIRFSVSDYGPDGTREGNDNVTAEYSITAPQLKSNEWIGIDINISAMASKNRLFILLFDLPGGATAPSGFYVDNIYFHK